MSSIYTKPCPVCGGTVSAKLKCYLDKVSTCSRKCGQAYRKPWSLRFRIEKHSIPEPMSGCWLWTASANSEGYGHLGVGGKTVRAHRVSWEAYKGPIPYDDKGKTLLVCHKCDNPSCVNPDHLFLGTDADNNADMMAKGRGIKGRVSPLKGLPRPQTSGAKNPNAKLTEYDVSIIRDLLSDGTLNQREIGDKFGVGESVISAIKLGHIWRSTS